jgi:hypothetical protein
MGVYGNANSRFGVYGYAPANAVYGFATNVYGVYGEAVTSFGVAGKAATDGVIGEATYYGVYGRADNKFGVVGNANYNAVYGWANVANGVRGFSLGDYGVSGGADNYGVYGYAAQTYGGYFNSGDKTSTLGVEGNIRMVGSLGYGLLYANGSLKAFTIDHPLDPACKVLRHFSTEGPEALVIYSGTAVLDATGQAAVVLPDYFDALSRDARVQLTPVGNHRVFVAEEVRGNTFTIGGDARAKVYWQVTAERDDPKARLERATRPVEQFKGTPGAPAKGQYVSPECYR